MKSHGPLRYKPLLVARPVGRHRREPPPGAARVQATRGIVVPALVLASLGGAASVAAGHGIAGTAHASAHQVAESPSVVNVANRPWIY
jgi:hypothetical protein